MDLFMQVLLLILARLPVKSLVRFRCVCKTWCALIQSPIFVQKHLSISHGGDREQILIKSYIKPKNNTILSFHSNDESLSVTAPTLEVSVLGVDIWDHYYVGFAGSSNGIVCIANGETIILSNPALREFRKLPTSPFGSVNGFRGKSICESVAFGFGYDPVSNDYKVVRILNLSPKEPSLPENLDSRNYYCRAEVYNLRTDSWRETKAIVPQSSLFCSYPWLAIFFKGCFHWFAKAENKRGEWCILSFHVSTERFRKIQRPPIFWDPDSEFTKTLAVLHEALACISYTKKPLSEESINIWVMNEYGVEKSWTKQYFIRPLSGYEYPLFCRRDNELLLESNNGQLVSYALSTNQQQQQEQPLQKYDIYGYPRSLGAVSYKESLVSINRNQ